MAINLGTIAVELDALTGEFNREMDKARTQLASIEGIAKKVGTAAIIAFTGGALAIGKAVAAASDAAEQLNVINVSFGELAPTVIKWADATADSIGRSALEVKGFAAQTQAMLAPMLGSAEAAAGMSTEITKLAFDIGSFMNKADADVLLALQSGLIGSAEPLRALGVNMSVAALDAFALSEGIGISTKEMSEAQKVALRFQFIMANTTDSQGDTIRTFDSFANATKRVRGQLKDLVADFGEAFIPVAEDALKVISDLLREFQGLSPEVKVFAAETLAAGTALSAFAAIASGLVLTLPALKAAWSTASKGMLKSIGKLLIPLGAIGIGLAGIILIIGTVKRVWSGDLTEMKDLFVSWGKTVVDVAKDVAKWLKSIFKPMIDFLSESLITIAGLVQGLGADEIGALQMAARAGGGLFAGAGEAAEVAFDDFSIGFNRTLDAMSDGAGAIFDALKGDLGEVGKSFDAGLGAVSEFADEVLKSTGILSEESDERKKKEKEQIPFLPAAAGILDLEGRAPEPKKEGPDEFVGPALPPGFLEEAAAPIVEISSGLGDSLAQTGGMLVSGLGDLGGTIQSVVSAAQIGGPVAAIIAGITDLLTQTEGFGKVLEVAGGILDGLLSAVEPLASVVGNLVGTVVGALQPALDAVGRILMSLSVNGLAPLFSAIGSLVQALAPIINVLLLVLTPVMDVLGLALRGLAIVVNVIAIGIGFVVNAVLDAMSTLIDVIADIADIFGAGDELRSFADSLRSSKVDVDGLIDDLDDLVSGKVSQDIAEGLFPDIPVSEFVDPVKPPLDGLADGFDEAGNSAKDMSESIKKATEALTNVPQGFKIALTRFRATNVGPSFDSLSPAGAAGPAGSVVIVNVGELKSDNPDAFLAEIKRRAEFSSFANTGTPIRTGTPFGAAA